MTTIFETYNFMDLLKDKKYVPETDVIETTYAQEINEMIDSVSAFVRGRTEDYDFMDLLGDKGYRSVNDNWVKAHNDNQPTIEAVS